MDNDKIKEMQAQIDLLTKMVSTNTKGNVTNDDGSYIEFESTSLSPVYLMTDKNREGEVYAFEKFGDKNNVPLVDAKNIIRHNKKFIQNGIVYINDEDFVKKENLSKYYKNIISANELNNIVLCKRETFGKRFETLTSKQQATVCGILFNKLREGKSVDEEVLFYINQLLGRDLKEEVADLELLLNNEVE